MSVSFTEWHWAEAGSRGVPSRGLENKADFATGTSR